jgi:hypothetical protein
LPFFKLLSAKNKITWGPEEQEAFEQFKLYLENLEILTSLGDKAKLLLYIAASASAVSATLVEEKHDKGQLKQVQVNFVLEALSGAKKFYSELEKMTYVVVMAAIKLKHYFQSYSIIVPTSYPLRKILENKESSVRVGKWATELSQYAIEFTSRTAIKSQVLAHFIADWTPSQGDKMNEDRLEAPWVMHCDGAYCDDGVASLAILMSPSGIKMRYSVRLDFEGKTNNVAEYEGLLLGLRKARAIGARRVIINTNSELITRQIGKSYKAKHDEMAKYLKTVRGMEKFFFGFTVKKNIKRPE